MFDLVLTMAGRGQRFADVGYEVCKAAIPARGQPLLWWSLLSVRHLLDHDSELVFVARREDALHDLVDDVCADLGLGSPSVVELEETTDGQATTALLGVRHLSEERPFFVFNADTHIREGALRVPPSCAAWVPYFEAEGEAWSFVRVDEQDRVLEVAEKRRISPHATVGLYSFPSATAYAQLYATCFDGELAMEVNGEKYIAPMYTVALAQGWLVTSTRVEADHVIPLGTPAELRAFDEGHA